MPFDHRWSSDCVCGEHAGVRRAGSLTEGEELRGWVGEREGTPRPAECVRSIRRPAFLSSDAVRFPRVSHTVTVLSRCPARALV